MNIKIFDKFSLLNEREGFDVVGPNIEKDASFEGTNLWILFFAILVASLGLNVNSTAVVIGAMLLSPLMGPIVGVGAGVALNDLHLIRKASGNYLFAVGVGLTASTIYFFVSPIRDAHAEILSRTQPTIYDVLISLFGGFAGIIAVSCRQKGNVIAGVAIATALMPPLCTAGYGLATGQLKFFFGAFYLYLINSVFIAAATIITVHLLKYPKKKYADPKAGKRERNIIWAIIFCTLIPSLYLGYDIVQKNKFTNRATRFIDAEAIFPNDYLLKYEIDPGQKKIVLTFGGKKITQTEIDGLKSKQKFYELENSTLEIRQGFTLTTGTGNQVQVTQLSPAIMQNEEERIRLKTKIDSIDSQKKLSSQVARELKIQNPDLVEAFIQPTLFTNDTSQSSIPGFLVLVNTKKHLKRREKGILNDWLRLRLNSDSVKIVVE
ncbi:MAG TPA: TIGR00341 family protein [Agriterribacter sp.]|nr:TIGR00341 family protein [Agriterribacter sp.]